MPLPRCRLPAPTGPPSCSCSMIRPSGADCKTSSSSRKRCPPSASSSPASPTTSTTRSPRWSASPTSSPRCPTSRPTLREPLTVIQEEAERASNIVKNLLSFARKQEHQRRPTALKPLLDATFVLLRNQLMAQRVEARIEVEPDLPMPDIDPNQIQQVFVNLINNAAQAIASTGRPGTRRGPRPPLARRRGHRRHRRRAGHVRDPGRPGRSSRSSPPSPRARAPGSASRSARASCASTAAASCSPPRRAGARPSRCSSRSPPGRPRPPPDAGAGAPTKRLRVLVVDDEPHILHYMRATLEAWGHIPVVAGDGAEALDAGRPASGST